MITTQRQVRKAFWDAWRSGLFGNDPRIPRRITNYRGDGKMHNTTLRCTFVDFVDELHESQQIDSALANRVTL